MTDRPLRLARIAAALQRPACALLLALTLLGSLALAGTRKAKNLYEQGRAAEVQKNYDEALALYEQADLEDPKDHRYELAVRRTRFIAAQTHVDQGRRLRDQGQFEEALAHFQRAMTIDPSLTVAAQQYRRTLELVERRDHAGEEQGAGAAGKDSQSNQEAKDLTASVVDLDRLEREQKVDSLKPPPDLKPMSTEPINVTMSQQATVVFETIGKLAGINVLFDPEFQDKKIDISIQNATLPDALDYASLIAKTYWKPITRNAIFVTNDSTNKRRDYEEEIVKTIYLNNVATPQELQEIVTAIRGLTDIRRMFPVTSMNALVLRGTEAKLALAEKVVHDIDKARPEVIIDVLVIESAKSRTRELGISPVSGDGNGISIPLTFTGGGVASGDSASSSLPLNRVGSVGSADWVTTLPGGQLTALFTNSDTNLLQSPRIRATDNQQASLRIGDRIPIATGSFQPGIGGVGVNPLVNTQFNYTDVGVNVDLTPKIHNDREVSLHVEIEISNVRGFQDIGGISQPIIGQRTITHDIRLEEGEASILGGLNQSQVFKTKSGVPFLGEIPLLGKLFSITRVEHNDNEVLVVLIPHIVRLPMIDESNLKEVASGTDQVFEVRYKQPKSEASALPPIGAAAQQEQQTAAQTPAPPAQTTPAPAAPGEPTPAPTEPAAAVEPAPGQPAPAATEAPPTPPEPSSDARLTFASTTGEVGVNNEVTLDVLADNVTDMFGSPLRISYDPKILNLEEITRGDFLAGPERTDLIFSRNIRNQVGQAAVNISRFPGTGGANGRGTLIQLRFKGVAAGQTTVNVVPAGARVSTGQPLQMQPAQMQVTVR